MIRFYVFTPGRQSPTEDQRPPDDVRVEIWRPGLLNVLPASVSLRHGAVWWTFHTLGVFANREYGAVLIRHGEDVVHSSLVMPRYFRFPVMGHRDVQIGATYTRPEWRGRGLARMAVRAACDYWGGRAERIWYIVETQNVASVRVIESCGFVLAGSGHREDRYGLKLLGQFRMTQPSTPNDQATATAPAHDSTDMSRRF
jgi:RimJ/RimL family protein N-acetyltransferase